MEYIEDQTFCGQSLSVDDKLFTNCVIEDCTLHYCGGEFRFLNTHQELLLDV